MTQSITRQWVERLAPLALPALEERKKACTAIGIKSLKQMSQLIATDPGLTLRLLIHVNRGRIKNPDRLEVSCLESATYLLGEAALKRLIHKAPVLKNPEQKKKGASEIEIEAYHTYTQLCDRIHHASLHVSHWSKLRKEKIPSESRIAALLSNFLELSLCVNEYQHYKAIRELMQQKRISFAGALKQRLGIDQHKLSIALARAWMLPSNIRDAVDPSHAYYFRARGVMFANELTRMAEFGWYHEDMHHCKTLIAEYLGTDFDQACHQIHQVALKAARDPFMMRPDIVAVQLLHPVIERNGQHKPTAIPVPVQQIFQSKQQSPQEIALLQAMDTIKHKLADGQLKTGELMKQLMQGSYDGTELNRCLFFIHSPGKSELHSKYSRGISRQHPLKALSVDVTEESLFKLLLQKPQSIHVNSSNFEKYAPLLPPALLGSNDTTSFICMSIFCDDKPLGILYGDRHSADDDRIPEATYKAFKRLCRLTTRSMGEIADQRRMQQAFEAAEASDTVDSH